MGVAVGDYDNDGFPDLFVTAYGRSILYRNNGDGTFTDVTGQRRPGRRHARLDDRRGRGSTTTTTGSSISSSAATSSTDLRQGGLACAEKNKDGSLYYHYCIPHLFKPTASVLWHNNGDGTFTQASRGTGIGRALGKALGVVATDINNDGLMDLVVANDTAPNFLFLNQGKNAVARERRRRGHRVQRVGQPALGHGRRRGGSERRRLAGSARRQHRPRDVLALRKPRRIVFHRRRPGPRRGAGDAAAQRLGSEILRLRQRRPRRSPARQRPSGRHDRPAGAGRALPGTAPLFPQRRTPACATSARRPGRCLRRRFLRAAWPSATTTTTGGWTSSSAATAARRCCCATTPRRKPGQPLGGAEAPGRQVQSRRDRRADHVVCRRRAALAPEKRRRQLSLVARSSRSPRPRPRGHTRLAGNQMAGAQRAGRSDSPASPSIAT